jgi:hypothetical protein
MEGTEHRTRMRARRGLPVLERVLVGLLSDDVAPGPGAWGLPGPESTEERIIAVPQARRDGDARSGQVRDVVAERERIRAELHRAHLRRARRRALLTRLV